MNAICLGSKANFNGRKYFEKCIYKNFYYSCVKTSKLSITITKIPCSRSGRSYPGSRSGCQENLDPGPTLVLEREGSGSEKLVGIWIRFSNIEELIKKVLVFQTIYCVHYGKMRNKMN